MKKFMTLAGFEYPHAESDNKKRYVHFRSLERKNAIIKFIQAGVIAATALVIFSQIYFSN